MIVVGIDGSDGSAAALEVAAGEAELRGTELRVVHAWHVPVPVFAGPLVVPPISREECAEDAAHQAAGQLETVRKRHPGVRATLALREGGAAAVLIRESEAAELTVVGSRGHGGFAGLLLGSVSQKVATHAASPVMIVPGPGGPDTSCGVRLGGRRRVRAPRRH